MNTTVSIARARQLVASASIAIIAAICLLFIEAGRAQPNRPAGTQAAMPRHGALLWSEEFDGPIDFTTSKHSGKWRANDDLAHADVGYKDHAGGSWNINPIQHMEYSPFLTRQGVLTITARQTPPAIVREIEATAGVGNAPRWSGGMLISEERNRRFRYGYFEVRARWPNPGVGMFPAIWLYVANGRHLPNPSKSGAEIDLLEIIGYPSGKPWEITVHRRDWEGRGDMDNVATVHLDTKDWHVYGLSWQPDSLSFFRDGVLLGQVSGDAARWFDVDMAIRLNFAVDGANLARKGRLSNQSTPKEMRMQVDYVRVYAPLQDNATGTGVTESQPVDKR